MSLLSYVYIYFVYRLYCITPRLSCQSVFYIFNLDLYCDYAYIENQKIEFSQIYISPKNTLIQKCNLKNFKVQLNFGDSHFVCITFWNLLNNQCYSSCAQHLAQSQHSVSQPFDTAVIFPPACPSCSTVKQYSSSSTVVEVQMIYLYCYI